jgi:hypothetical protein
VAVAHRAHQTTVLSVEVRASLAMSAIRTANARLATRTAAAKPGRSWWCHGRVLVVEVVGCRDIWARWAEYQWWYCSVNFTPASPGNSVASFSNARHTECTIVSLSSFKRTPVIAVSRVDDHRTLVARRLLYGRIPTG